ncbi:hypothetical protein [Lacrimispora sp.]|uniref:hypothetical protein n=1 Tax=Lacrimispora sp. TaxID=2719234 RepID=UPI00399234A1
MNKHCYVVQNEGNKAKKEYLVGFMYGNPNATEEELTEYTKAYCEEKKYRLALLVQIPSNLPIMNQIYPHERTEETIRCLEYVLQAAMKEGENHGLRI